MWQWRHRDTNEQHRLFRRPLASSRACTHTHARTHAHCHRIFQNTAQNKFLFLPLSASLNFITPEYKIMMIQQSIRGTECFLRTRCSLFRQFPALDKTQRTSATLASITPLSRLKPQSRLSHFLVTRPRRLNHASFMPPSRPHQPYLTPPSRIHRATLTPPCQHHRTSHHAVTPQSPNSPPLRPIHSIKSSPHTHTLVLQHPLILSSHVHPRNPSGDQTEIPTDFPVSAICVTSPSLLTPPPQLNN
jgi:hypothetical protein